MRPGRYRANPFVDPDHRPAPADPAVLRFHQSIDAYQPSPYRSMPKLAALLGIASLQVKDESQRFGLGSHKVLGASWAASRTGRRTQTLTTASMGNFGRGLAWACRQLGHQCVVFLPAGAGAHRAAEIAKLGARIITVEGKYDDALRACARQSQALGWRVITNTSHGSQVEGAALVMEGYQTLFVEADTQRVEQGLPPPNLVIVQAGSGALAGAAVRHFTEPSRNPKPAICVVEPIESACCLESIESVRGTPSPATGAVDSVMECLNCTKVSTASWLDLRAGVKLFAAMHDGWTERAMRTFYRPPDPDPRITAGASGAAGLGGLMALLESPEFAGARRTLRLGPETHAMILVTEGDNDPEHFAQVVTR